jgi:hypothetical protein
MMPPDFDLRKVFIAVFVVGMIVALLAMGSWRLASASKDDGVIRSYKRIEPDIELKVRDGNKIDTVYIYRKP